MKTISTGLILHFLLELSGMAALVYWGFSTGQTAFHRILLGLGVPLLAAFLWATFRVPNDPGPAPIAVPGPMRLILELVILGGAAAALFACGKETLALTFASVIVIDYGLMYARVKSLLLSSG